MDIAKDVVSGCAVGFGFYLWVTYLNQNLEAAAVTSAALLAILLWVALREYDRHNTLNDLDTFKDVSYRLP